MTVSPTASHLGQLRTWPCGRGGVSKLPRWHLFLVGPCALLKNHTPPGPRAVDYQRISAEAVSGVVVFFMNWKRIVYTLPAASVTSALSIALRSSPLQAALQFKVLASSATRSTSQRGFQFPSGKRKDWSYRQRVRMGGHGRAWGGGGLPATSGMAPGPTLRLYSGMLSVQSTWPSTQPIPNLQRRPSQHGSLR